MDSTTKQQPDTGPLSRAADAGADEPVWADDEAGQPDDVWAADDGEGAERPNDPLVHALLVFAMALVVTLVATTGVLYFYLSSLNKAPRTMAERDVATAESVVAEDRTSATAWARLAYAYAGADRYEEALEALERAKTADDADALVVVKADVLRLSGRSREAVTEYDRALTEALKIRERIRVERSKVGITGDIGDDGLLLVYWGRGLAKKDIGEINGAIADLELASKENSRQVDIWVELGDLYAEKGDAVQAEQAYRAALMFVPDFAGAIQGLRDLGKE
ncbi:MAG: hypothetical protein U1E26_04460 [Coriobacteriia bacterium]|nr:hypothetical protein [Coriobacteriia bacterium]